MLVQHWCREIGAHVGRSIALWPMAGMSNQNGPKRTRGTTNKKTGMCKGSGQTNSSGTNFLDRGCARDLRCRPDGGGDVRGMLCSPPAHALR